jgi:hypothetical protein
VLTAKRDAAAAKRFFRKALSAPGNPVPRVINVDKNPAFPPAVEALKDTKSVNGTPAFMPTDTGYPKTGAATSIKKANHTETRTHLTNSSTGSDRNRDVAFPESSRRSVRKGRQACGSSAAKQTVSRSSSVCGTAAGGGHLASYSFDCGGAVRLPRSRRV